MINIIFVIICVHHSSALRQCTIHSKRLYSHQSKQRALSAKESSIVITLDAEECKKTEEIVCQVCTGGLEKRTPGSL